MYPECQPLCTCRLCRSSPHCSFFLVLLIRNRSFEIRHLLASEGLDGSTVEVGLEGVSSSVSVVQWVVSSATIRPFVYTQGRNCSGNSWRVLLESGKMSYLGPKALRNSAARGVVYRQRSAFASLSNYAQRRRLHQQPKPHCSGIERNPTYSGNHFERLESKSEEFVGNWRGMIRQQGSQKERAEFRGLARMRPGGASGFCGAVIGQLRSGSGCWLSLLLGPRASHLQLLLLHTQLYRLVFFAAA